MRHVREVMRMHREACVPMREIARLTGLARSTVRDMIVRFDRSGLAWPVPSEIGDTDLEGRLYGASGIKPGRRKLPEPDWPVVARELKRKHVTLQGTRPIFHQSDAAIRGHVFVSFLALTLAKELSRLCQEKGLQPEWQPLLNDLDRLQEATIEKDGKVITTRTHVSGQVGNVFKATGIALPANISEFPPQT